MPQRAKLFATPEGQAVRLPEEYRFDQQEEILIYKEGRRVILEPEHRRWSRRFLKLAGSAPDFPHPDEPPPAEPAERRGRSRYRCSFSETFQPIARAYRSKVERRMSPA